MRALLRRDESLDQRRRGAAAEPLSADRRQHARPDRRAEVSIAARASENRPKRTRPIACSTGWTSRRRASSASIRPKRTASYPILVPQVDDDGNELAGVKMPEIAVPLATYTGWNLFNAESGPTSLLSSMQGSYIPLPRTRADRERTKDPRTSIEERYREPRTATSRSSRRPRRNWCNRATCSKTTWTTSSNGQTSTGAFCSRMERRALGE